MIKKIIKKFSKSDNSSYFLSFQILERQHESVLDCCKAKQVPRLCLGMCIDRKMPFKNILRFAGVKCSKHSKNVISCKEGNRSKFITNIVMLISYQNFSEIWRNCN